MAGLFGMPLLHSLGSGRWRLLSQEGRVNEKSKEFGLALVLRLSSFGQCQRTWGEASCLIERTLFPRYSVETA